MPESHPARPVGSVFVGRQRETTELMLALADAVAGQGRLVLLSGESGIGKSRLTREFASLAEHEGARVLWGWCPEEEGAPPFWPWQQIIRAYIQQCGEEQLVSEMGAGAAEIAEIVPEVRSLIPGLHQSEVLEADQSRFRLFDSITAFVKNAANYQPLVLVVDDLQWADRSSLMLLEFLAREMRDSRLLVVGAYAGTGITREHPLSQTLGGLVREPHFSRIQLSGLNNAEVGEMVEAWAEIALPANIVDEIWLRTDGNPLFVGEVVRMMTSEELGRKREWAEAIPEGIHNVINRRLGHLSGACNQILRVAAVIGKEFDYRLLEALSSGLGQEGLIEALEEATSQGVIEELPQQAAGYQFVHTLVQQTLIAEVSAARRSLLHERIAGELEERYGRNSEAHASELAHRFAQSTGAAATDKLVHYSRLAGERALATFAYDDALSHFQQALAARGSRVPAVWEGELNDEIAPILFGMAQGQAATFQRGQLQEARTNLSRVLDYYLATGDVSRAVMVAVYPIPPFGGTGATVRTLDRILSLVPPESIEAGVLHARRGFVMGVEEGDFQGAQDAFERALLIAIREKDLDLEMRTLADAARVDSYNHWWGSSLEKSLRAVELAQRAGNPRLELAARYRAAWALLTLGDANGAIEISKPLLEIAETVQDRYWLVNTLWLNELLSRLQGHWQASADFSDRGLAIWPRDPRLLGSRTLLEYETGNFGTGKEFLERLIAAMASTPSGSSLEYANVACVVPMIVRISGHNDQLGRASRACETILSSSEATEGLVNDAKAGLGLIAVIQFEMDNAEKHYSALAAENGQVLFSSLSGDRLLGLLAYTLGRYGDAATHFEDALTFCRGAGYRPELAWACHDYADCLLARNTLGDQQKAASLLDESVKISTELGMGPLMERAEALRARMKSGPELAPALPDGLTNREAEVLRLIAVGKSSRDVAEELVLSIRTVERHITNIYGKINARGRADATAYALGHDLLDQQ